MSRKEVKELEEKIIEILKEPARNYREKAIKELAENKTSLPNAMEIVSTYPEFDSVRFRVTQKGHFLVDIYINVDDLKNNPKAIHEAAKTIVKFRKM